MRRFPHGAAMAALVAADVLDFFRRRGRGRQTRINAVLRGYVEQMRAKGRYR